MLKPGKTNANYDIELSDGRSEKAYGLILAGDGAIQEASVSEDQFAAYIRNVGKKFGDFDEQRSWKGGRGVEYFNDNSEGFWDSLNCWTMTQNHLVPTLQWKFGKGLRSCDFSMPGDMKWVALIDSNLYLEDAFTASASYSADKCWAWIRRRGSPGTLTMEICADDGGDPGTAAKTVTKTITDITDTVSVLEAFDWATTTSLTSSTAYHVKFYGASTDSSANHWEIGCDDSVTGQNSTDGSSWSSCGYAPYYRVTDADTSRKWFMFTYYGAMFAVDSKDSGSASVLYINGDMGVATSATSTVLTDSNSGLTSGWTTDQWAGAYIKIFAGTGRGQVRAISSNTSTAITVSSAFYVTPDATSQYIIYSTPYFTQITGHGLGKVVSQPIVVGTIIYFPQGTTAIRRGRWNSATPGFDWAADSTNTADYMLVSYTSSKPVIWRAINGTTVQVSRSDVKAWATDLVFGTGISVGETHYLINNLVIHDGREFVFKENSVWSIVNDIPVEESFGVRSTPDPYLGVAAVSHNKFLFFNWLYSVERVYGGTVDDIGLDWRSDGLPAGREGYINQFVPAVGWLFAAVNAGTGGTSSVLCWDGLAWHEILRGFASGRQIRDIYWQTCDGTRNRLWTNVGGELVYQEFPLYKASPVLDSGACYQHEGVIESSIIDMGAASRLSKYIKGLTLLSRHLNGSIVVELDYQVDDDIGSTTWTSVSPGYMYSPEQELVINEADIRQFRYRLRLNTTDANTPPDVMCVVPNGYARIPWRTVWHIRIKAGDIYAKGGRKNVDPEELRAWLRENAMYPGVIRMESVFSQLHDKYVVIAPPSVVPFTPPRANIPGKSYITISLMEI